MLAQQCFNLSIMLSGCGIANQDTTRSCELIDCLEVRFDTVGLTRAVIQFSQHDTGNEDLSCFGEALMNRGIFGEDSDNDIRVKEKATIH